MKSLILFSLFGMSQTMIIVVSSAIGVVLFSVFFLRTKFTSRYLSKIGQIDDAVALVRKINFLINDFEFCLRLLFIFEKMRSRQQFIITGYLPQEILLLYGTQTNFALVKNDEVKKCLAFQKWLTGHILEERIDEEIFYLFNAGLVYELVKYQNGDFFRKAVDNLSLVHEGNPQKILKNSYENINALSTLVGARYRDSIPKEILQLEEKILTDYNDLCIATFRKNFPEQYTIADLVELHRVMLPGSQADGVFEKIEKHQQETADTVNDIKNKPITQSF